jgi:hypothetical protein
VSGSRTGLSTSSSSSGSVVVVVDDVDVVDDVEVVVDDVDVVELVDVVGIDVVVVVELVDVVDVVDDGSVTSVDVDVESTEVLGGRLVVVSGVVEEGTAAGLAVSGDSWTTCGIAVDVSTNNPTTPYVRPPPNTSWPRQRRAANRAATPASTATAATITIWAFEPPVTGRAVPGGCPWPPPPPPPPGPGV